MKTKALEDEVSGISDAQLEASLQEKSEIVKLVTEKRAVVSAISNNG